MGLFIEPKRANLKLTLQNYCTHYHCKLNLKLHAAGTCDSMLVGCVNYLLKLPLQSYIFKSYLSKLPLRMTILLKMPSVSRWRTYKAISLPHSQGKPSLKDNRHVLKRPASPIRYGPDELKN